MWNAKDVSLMKVFRLLAFKFLWFVYESFLIEVNVCSVGNEREVRDAKTHLQCLRYAY